MARTSSTHRKTCGCRTTRPPAVGQAEVREFAVGLDVRLSELATAIRKDAAPVGRFRQFLIPDPQGAGNHGPRFDDHVLHHAIMNVCKPVLGRWSGRTPAFFQV